MPSIAITVGTRRFSSKKALIEACSTILRSGSVDDEATAFLIDLLERHPDRDEKIGVGVRRISVGPDGYGRTCFWIERIDGKRTDFSFHACVTAPSAEADAQKAFRSAVRPQVAAFRDAAFAGCARVLCAITGAPVAQEDAHVDHRPPSTFLNLLRAFLAGEQLALGTVQVNDTADGDTSTRLVDGPLERRRQEYHRANAVLQVTCARANLSQGGRGGAF